MLKESFGEIGEADQWPQRARVQSVDLKHVFNRRYERGVLFLRDTPVLAAVRLKPVFFNALRTDSSEILSTSSSSTTRSARSWSVQRAQPSGGSKQANALISASSFPSTLISRGGTRRFLRSRDIRGPCSWHCLRNRSIELTAMPVFSAISTSLRGLLRGSRH